MNVWNMLANVKNVPSHFACAVALSLVASGVSADDLTAYGLPSDTRVYAPGNGVATNVTEKIDGAVNVQANATSTGGGLVTLANSANTFSGGAYVKSGTLAVPSVGRALLPSALGQSTKYSGTHLVLGNGTFHYTGPAATLDGDILIKSDQTLQDGIRPVVMKVDDELVLTGQVKVDGKYAAFMKNGPGTLILRTRMTGVQNTFAKGDKQIYFANGYVNAPANGDSPMAAVSSFQVTDGRFVIDTPNTVTNVFGDHESGIGIRSTSVANAETAAYLDIYGGVNKFGNWLCAARNNGDTTTAPQGLRSEITVYGGDSSANNFGLAYCADNNQNYTMTGVMTVHGGRLGCSMLRVDHTKSRGEVNVDGGRFDVGNASISHIDSGAKFTANISGDGVFQTTGTFDASLKGQSTVTVNVSENGLFDCNVFKASQAGGTIVIHANGGTLQMRGDWSAGTCCVGTTGTTIRSYNATPHQWSLPLQSEAGLVDGGVDVTGSGEIDFNAAISLQGGLRVHDADVGLKNATCDTIVEQKGTGALKTFKTPVALSGLVQTDTATMKIGFNGTTPSALTTSAWTPPKTLRLYLLQGDTTTAFTTAGDYALLIFPASVEFDAANAQVVNVSRGLDYALRVVENTNGTKTLRVTISNGEGGSATESVIYLPNGYTTNATEATWSDNIVATSTVNRMAGLYLEKDLVLDAPMTQNAGGFIKAGPGTLTFAGNWDYDLAKTFNRSAFLGTGGNGNILDPNWFDAAGNSINSYAGGAIFRGKMVVGRPGVDEQPNVSIGNDEFWVGTFTTMNGTEYAGELEINSGAFRVRNGFLCLARNNGWADTQADEWLESKLTLNGGLLEVAKFILAYDNSGQSKTRPVMTINGGTFRQTATDDVNAARFGNSYGRGCDASFIVNGGRAEFAARGFFNYGGQWSPNVVFEMNGGFVDFAGGVYIASARLCRFNLKGGTLRVVGGLNAADANTKLTWGGTTFRPVAGADVSIGGFGSPTLDAGGLVVDMTEMRGGWLNVFSAFAGEGGVTVSGTNTSRAVCFRSVQTFTGDVVVNAGAGVAIATGMLPTQTVRVKNGAALWTTVGGSSADGDVGTLVLGDAESDVVTLGVFQTDSGEYVPLTVKTELTVNGTVNVAVRRVGQTTLSTPADGAQQILRAPKGTIDPTKFKVDETAFPSVQVSFAVDTSADGYDALTMTATANAAHVHTWTATSDGAWDVANNWSSLPDDRAGDRIVFLSSFAGGTVSMAGAEHTLERLSSASSGAVALVDGRLAFDDAGLVSATAGSLTLPDVASERKLRVDVEKGATVEFAGTTATGEGIVTPKTKDAGTIRVTGELQSDITITSGRLEAKPSALGSRTVALTGTTLRPTESGVSEANLVGTGNNTGCAIDVPEGVEFVHAGGFASKRFFKTGAGTLWLTPSTTDWTMSDATSYSISGTQVTIPDNGDVPFEGLGGVAVFGGRLVMGRAGETIHANIGEFWVGSRPTFGADGKVLDTTFDFYDGNLEIGSFLGVGRSWNISFGDLDRQPVYTLNQYGGAISAVSFVMNWDNKQCQSVHAVYNMYGGSFTCGSLTQTCRFAMGSHRCTDSATVAKLGENVSDFNVYGGTVTLNRVNEGASLSGHNGDGCLGRLNLYGGTFQSDVPLLITKGGQLAKGKLLLAGGTLIAPKLTHTSGMSVITWDGGTFRPSTRGELSGMTTNQVAAGGAVIDVSLVDGYTLNQTLTHDSACAGVDGGLTKTGAGTLFLAKPMAFTGPLSVLGGAVDVKGSTAYKLAGVEGCGQVTNGTVVVSGAVAPRGADTETTGTGNVLTVDSLVFGTDSSWRVNTRVSETGVTADVLRTEGSLTATTEPVTVDFQRTEDDPLPNGYRAKIGTFVQKPTTHLWFKAVNHGLTRGRTLVVRYENDGTEIWATAIPSASVIIFR